MTYTIPNINPLDSIRNVVDAVKYCPETDGGKNVLNITVPVSMLSPGLLSAVAKAVMDGPDYLEVRGKSGRALTRDEFLDCIGQP